MIRYSLHTRFYNVGNPQHFTIGRTLWSECWLIFPLCGSTQNTDSYLVLLIVPRYWEMLLWILDTFKKSVKLLRNSFVGSMLFASRSLFLSLILGMLSRGRHSSPDAFWASCEAMIWQWLFIQMAKMGSGARPAAPASDVQHMHLWALSPREMTQLERRLW